MGFADAAQAIATGMISTAVDLLEDFQVLIGVIFGIAALGMLFIVVKQFIEKKSS